MLKRIISLFLILCFTSIFFGCQEIKDYKELGIPTAERFNNGVLARCVWDIKLWEDNLYIGSGDYNTNTGPTDIWAYNLNNEQWTLSGTVADESVVRFNIINNNLIAPGVDPTASWEKGNYYALENGAWQTYRVLPNAIHAFDIIEHNNIVLVGIGCELEYYPALVSYDNGTTFNHLTFYKDGTPYSADEYEYSRTYELFIFNNEVYALVYHKLLSGDYSLELFKFENYSFVFVCNASSFRNPNRISVNYLNSKEQFKENFFVSTNYLYVSNNLTDFEKVELPCNEFASQIKIYEDKLYVLCYEKLSEHSYIVKMYSSESGTNDFEEFFSFDYPVPPLCFEKNGNVFYVGMGNRYAINSKNGMVLQIET